MPTEPATGRLSDQERERIYALVSELRRTDLVPGVEVGEPAPDFTLPDAEGRPVTLHDRLRLGPVVLTFYRGAWCPYCNLQLRALQASLPVIAEAGASLLAVSPQPPDRSLDLSDKLELGFDVLSDLEQEVAAAYRIRFTVSGDAREVYEAHLPIPDQNADGSWNLPVPATFVIGTDGLVHARHVDVDYRERMAPADILAALRALRS